MKTFISSSLVLLLLSYSESTLSQKLDLSGLVNFEDQLDRPTDATTVTLTDSKGVKKTTGLTGNGNFEFKRCALGNYQVRIEARGYEVFDESIVLDFSSTWITKLIGIKLKKKGSRVRTRVVNDSEFTQAQQNMFFTNTEESITNMLAVVKNYTNQDKEYFEGHQAAGHAYGQRGNMKKALYHFDLAKEALNKNYPFYHPPGLPNFPKRLLTLLLAQSIAQLYVTNQLIESGIHIMEGVNQVADDEFDTHRSTHYGALAGMYSSAGQEEKAISVLLVLKDFFESSYDVKSKLKKEQEQIYKVDKDDPKYVKKMQKEMAKNVANNPDLIAAYENVEVVQRQAAKISYSYALGELYLGMYRYREAIPYLLESDSILKVMQETTSKSVSKMMEGQDERLKQLEQSIVMSEESLKSPHLDEKTKEMIRQSIESTKKTLEYSGKVGQIKTKDFTSTMQEIASTGDAAVIPLFKSGQKEKAKKYAKGLYGKATFEYLSGNYDASKNLINQQIEMYSAFKDDSFFGLVSQGGIDALKQNLQAKVEMVSGNFPAALALLTEGLQKDEKNLQDNLLYLSESQRKEYFKGYFKKLDSYYSLLSLNVKQSPGSMIGMLNKSIQTKGLILDVTLEQEKAIRKISDPVALQQLATLRSRRAKLAAFSQAGQTNPSQAMADSARRYSGLINDLQRKVNEKIVTPTIIRNITWKDIQNKLVQGDAFVEVVRINRDNFQFDKPVPQYWAFVVKPGIPQPITALLGEGEDFEGRHFKFYQNQLRSSLEDKASYDLYWKQIADATKDSKRIFLSADGLYHLLNPVTLKNPTTSNYVLDETELVRIATGRDLLNKKVALQATTLAILGNPDFTMSRKTGDLQSTKKTLNLNEVIAADGTRSGFSMLPGTLKEIDLITTRASSRGITVQRLESKDANELKIKALRSPGILHIATHGEFDTRSTVDSYLRSKLILAGAADDQPFTLDDYERFEDGFLTAYEVSQLDLAKTKLVVLSACETGLGEVQSGEGVWGLQRAFQLAGAQGVMGSLWKISDEATVTYMDTFYKSLLGGASSQQSYLAAMNETRKVFPHPYYWGAFVLNGYN
ncbi:MAG: CHAT domain-containing protein [Cytophagales bacterium]|nr:CHAT domain-containing protein [Cytophagales bacterium]